jgi:hypothetical protein
MTTYVALGPLRKVEADRAVKNVEIGEVVWGAKRPKLIR